MILRGRARTAARLCCAAACALACHESALAQSTGSAELDPTAPLDPLPDLGVEWPDMQACLPKIVAKLGRPLADDGDLVLFALFPAMPAAGIPSDGGTGGGAEDRVRNARGG